MGEKKEAASGNQARVTPDWQQMLAPIVAVLVLLGFGGFIIHMLGMTGEAVHEPQWSRALYLYNGVEAIAFAAAGFFFGREIHRARAEKAEERADSAEKKATEAENRAGEAEKKGIEASTKGKALTEAIKAKAASQNGRAASQGALEAGQIVAGTQEDLDELSRLADSLFSAV